MKVLGLQLFCTKLNALRSLPTLLRAISLRQPDVRCRGKIER